MSYYFHLKLPRDRYRSVAWQNWGRLQWNCFDYVYYTKYPDGGDILAQENIQISQNDYLKMFG